MRVWVAILISLLFYVLVFFEYDFTWVLIEGYFPKLITFISLSIYITISINFLLCLNQLFKRKNETKNRPYIPAIIYLLVLVGFHFFPYHTSELFKSSITEKVCYEGKMNTATLKLRNDGTFSIRHTDLFDVTFSWGKYSKSSDTLTLDFHSNKNKYWNKFLEEEVIYRQIRKPSDKEIDMVLYKGECEKFN